MAEGIHNYALQRSYEYDSHDENHNFNGLTVEDWKKQILEDWSADTLKANHVTIIFHTDDKDQQGVLKGLHAHGISNQKEKISQSAMMKRAKCSCMENCTPIKPENKFKAYRYLLHITEKAIADHKHIYSENELIFSVAEDYDKPFGLTEYHNMIDSKAQDSQETKDEKKLITKVVKDILAGKYDPQSDDDNTPIYDRIIIKDDIANAMAQQPSLYRKVMNAIALQDGRNGIAIRDREDKEKAREHMLHLADICGDEWAEYRKQNGITLEECLKAREYLQDEAAR